MQKLFDQEFVKLATLKNKIEKYDIVAKEEAKKFSEYLKKKIPDPDIQNQIIEGFDNFLKEYKDAYDIAISKLINELDKHDNDINHMLQKIEEIIEQHIKNSELN